MDPRAQEIEGEIVWFAVCSQTVRFARRLVSNQIDYGYLCNGQPWQTFKGTQMNKDIHANRAGWSIPDWCASVNLARATLYTLPANLQPASVKIGKRRIITEQPADYLKRLANATAHAE